MRAGVVSKLSSTDAPRRDASVLLSTAALAFTLQPDHLLVCQQLCELIEMGDEDAAQGRDWQVCIIRTIETLEFAILLSPGEERAVYAAFRVLLRAKGRLQLLTQLSTVCTRPLAEGMLSPLWRQLFVLLEAGDRGAFARLVPLLLSLHSLCLTKQPHAASDAPVRRQAQPPWPGAQA